MIVRDEEQFLAACLESVHDVVDEIVIVDTGSRDRTMEIARGFGARVFEYPWTEHFADARNHSLHAARGEFVLQLDADERLDPESRGAIRQAVKHDDFDLGLLAFIDMDGEVRTGRRWQAPRLFRRAPSTRYFGRIHEQIALDVPVIRRKQIGATVLHFGYTPALYAARQKTARSERLLLRAIEDPESTDPVVRANYLYHLAQLGQGLDLFTRFEDFAHFIRAQWGRELPAAPWISGGLVQHCILLSDQQRHVEAADLARELIARYGHAPLLHFVLARASFADGEIETAEREVGEVLRPDPRLSIEHSLYGGDIALVRSRAHFLQGVLDDCRQRFEDSLLHYQAAYSEEPEQEYFLGATLCSLMRLGRYVHARDLLEGSGAATQNGRPQLDCLGLALALLTHSGGRLSFWGTKVRMAAQVFAPARHMLERLEQLGSQHAYMLEDFAELYAAVWNVPDPRRFALPPTIRRSSIARADGAAQ